MEELQLASEDEEEPEIEYVEGYDDLEEEDDMEDFAGLAIHNHETDNDSDGIDDDHEETDVPRRKGRKESTFASRKLEKDETGAILKKGAKVTVEVEHEDADERQQQTAY